MAQKSRFNEDVERLSRLKSAMVEAQTRHDEARGELRAAERALVDMGYNTVADAENELGKLRAKAQDMQDKIKSMINDLEDEFHELLR